MEIWCSVYRYSNLILSWLTHDICKIINSWSICIIWCNVMEMVNTFSMGCGPRLFPYNGIMIYLPLIIVFFFKSISSITCLVLQFLMLLCLHNFTDANGRNRKSVQKITYQYTYIAGYVQINWYGNNQILR